MPEYMVRDTRWVRGANPALIASELQEVADKNDGDLTTEAILRRARNKASVLHALPEWSWNIGSRVAAERWDRHVARNVNRSVLVTFEKPDGTSTKPVQAFVTLESTGERRSTAEVLQNRGNRTALIAQYISALRRLERDLDAIVELGDLLSPVYTRLEEALEEARARPS
jgi:hypothetical protein